MWMRPMYAHVPFFVPLDSSHIRVSKQDPHTQWRVLFASLPFRQKKEIPKTPQKINCSKKQWHRHYRHQLWQILTSTNSIFTLNTPHKYEKKVLTRPSFGSPLMATKTGVFFLHLQAIAEPCGFFVVFMVERDETIRNMGIQVDLNPSAGSSRLSGSSPSKSGNSSCTCGRKLSLQRNNRWIGKDRRG